MKKIFYLFLCCALLLSCRKNNDPELPKVAEVTTKTIALDSDQNSSLMFQDNESPDVMTSDARRYNIGHVLRIKAVDQKNIEISNFAPVDIENATILATISNSIDATSKQVVKFFKISKIRAHGKQTIKYPFVDGTTLFLDTNNKVTDLSQYKETGIDPAKISFDFTGDNPIILKLKKLAMLKWDIQYHDYDPNNDVANNWAEDITAKDIRRFTGLMINLGSVYISQDFKTEFLNERIVANDGTTVLTDAQKLKTYNDILNHSFFQCGVVTNVSGLGGGSTLGYANHVIKDYINVAGAGDILSHEVGHCVGYGHSSNMTYPIKVNNVNTGISPVTIRVMQKLFNEKMFPVTPENYYKPADLK